LVTFAPNFAHISLKTTSKKNVQLFVQQLVAHGLRFVVCSPGSRNAPLVIALNQHPETKCIVIPDERSAAFYALGMAQHTTDFVAVVCTSGSAVLNYSPAIAESFYQSVPLIVITADRPEEWVNQGDGQTIVQKDVFKNHILFSDTIPENEQENTSEWKIRRIVGEGISYLNGGLIGPIHFNVPLSEPLYDQLELDQSNQPVTLQKIVLSAHLNEGQKESLQNTWRQSTKKMVLVGQHKPDLQLQNLLNQLSEDPSVIILTEHTSNMYLEQCVSTIDRTLERMEFSKQVDYRPEILLVLGGAIVSKRIKTLLRKFHPDLTWKVGYDFPFMDTYQSLNQTFEMNSKDFVSNLVGLSTHSTYSESWYSLQLSAANLAKGFIDNLNEISDLKVIEQIIHCLPEKSHLHLANSSVIRYALLMNPSSKITYWCNRGTSGIDGSSSTACGAAFISKENLHTLITGDISFFYDSNAFWNNLNLPNLRVVMINNGGGGIFKILPGPNTTEEFDDFFVYNQKFSAKYICKTFGIHYTEINDLTQLNKELNSFFEVNEDRRPKLIEVFTPKDENAKILNNYFNTIQPI
jgi:2-succinyl-5-enolpyruvyl-6-hydroxy-3-cyclohexene-1-carboxylate synthase